MTWQDVVTLIKEFVHQYWPALALALWDLEEEQKDHVKKELEAAQLQIKNAEDEKAIRDKFADKSAIDAINGIIGDDPNKPKS